MVCFTWLLLSYELLHILAEKIEIIFSEDMDEKPKRWLDLLFLPYRMTQGKAHLNLPRDGGPSAHTNINNNDKNPPGAEAPFLLNRRRGLNQYFIVRVTMRGNNYWS
jgi:hypothetical protein